MRVLIAVAASTILLAGCGIKGQLPPYLGLIASDDAGERWERVGRVAGEPYRFKALGAERLDLALGDGTIVSTQDGGRRWQTTFRP